MLGDIKSKILDSNRGTTTTPTITRPPSQPLPSPVEPTAAAEPASAVSTVAKGMAVVGKITCEGVLQVFGRIEGELRGATVMIGESAQLEGSIIAQDLTVDGQVKGTIHANRVKLRSSARVNGDIFHRSLSIEENAQFEGTSRREENPAQSAADTRSASRVETVTANGGATPVMPLDAAGLEHTTTQ